MKKISCLLALLALTACDTRSVQYEATTPGHIALANTLCAPNGGLKELKGWVVGWAVGAHEKAAIEMVPSKIYVLCKNGAEFHQDIPAPKLTAKEPA